MKFASCLAALVMATCALPASAGLVTIDGSDISVSYDPSNFVAGPGTSGDAISYSTGSISAHASGNISATSSAVTFIIQLTNPNDQFNNVSLLQYGQYSLSGPGASVSLAGSALNVSAGALSTSSAITPATALTQNDGATHAWAASASDSLSGSAWSGVRTIDVTVSQMLTASAPAGSSAMIVAGSGAAAGNASTITVGLSTTPLPPAVAMFAGGLALLAGLAAWRRVAPQQARRNPFAAS